MAKEKQLRNVDHPVTNGQTKAMIRNSLRALALLAFMSTIFLFINPFFLSGLTLWIAKGAIAGIATTSIGGLIYAIRSFFDTRESTQKEKDKQILKDSKYKHKEIMHDKKTARKIALIKARKEKNNEKY